MVFSALNKAGGASLGEFAATDRVTRPIDGFTSRLLFVYN